MGIRPSQGWTTRHEPGFNLISPLPVCVGSKAVSDRIWLVAFMHDDPAFLDHGTCRFEPIADPIEPKALPVSPV
jgi:hypothetical protein